jgi:hypothetical protein
MEGAPAEVVANIALCLIHQANDLLDRQISRTELTASPARQNSPAER